MNVKALQTAAATAAATLVVLLLTGAKSPPRKVEPAVAPCDIPCLEAKNAALQKLAVKRLRLLSAREHRIVHLLTRLHGGDARARSAGNRVSGGVKGVICSVFGAHCSEALRVAWCESRYNVRATNGDYWGLFQFGSFAREQYGFAWDAGTQTRAAYRYYLDAGWSPWACKP